jgi:hypothetical protein
MDEFDKRIKSAKQTYEPTPGFVDRTMEEVHKHKVAKRRFGFKLWAPALAGFAVLALAVVFFLPREIQSNVIDHKPLPDMSQKTTQTGPTESPAAISDGTDNTSLAADLNAAQTAMNQSASDQANTDAAVNDQAQAINVQAN